MGAGGIGVEAPLFHMPNHADDFRRDVQDVEVDALADRILAAEGQSRANSIVNDDHER